MQDACEASRNAAIKLLNAAINPRSKNSYVCYFHVKKNVSTKILFINKKINIYMDIFNLGERTNA